MLSHKGGGKVERVKVKEIIYPGGYKEIIIHSDVKNTKNNKQGGRKKGIKAVDTKDENIKRRIYRVKRDIKRLALVNRLYRMMTLTFRENLQDVDEADKLFKKYMYKLKLLGYKELKYISVRERQERGAIHYHCLISDFVPFRIAYEVWMSVVGGGSVNFKYVGIKGIYYLIKYVEKNIEENIFIGGRGYAKKSYTVSKGMKRLCDDMVREYYMYVINGRKFIGYEAKRIFSEIDMADKMGQLVYMQDGYYGDENQYKYRCYLIAPEWDKSWVRV